MNDNLAWERSILNKYLLIFFITFSLIGCGGEEARDRLKIRGLDEAQSRHKVFPQIVDMETNSSSYLEGDTLSVRVKFDQAVIVSGTPTLGFQIDGITKDLTYVAGGGSDTLLFEYNVLATDQDLDGVVISNSISVAPSDSIKSTSEKNASLTVADEITSDIDPVKINDRIELSPIANQVINEDTTLSGVVFSHTPDINCATDITATSDNTSLVQNSNITISSNGVRSCELTLTPEANAVGGALITITANDGVIAGESSFNLTVTNLNDAPVTANITPANFNEDTESIIAIPYTDIDGDSATTCSVSNLSNVSVSTVCSCSAGSCSVGVTGSTDYNGGASFDFAVTANGQSSNTSTATLTIDPVNDLPVIGSNQTENTNDNVVLSITLNAGSDVDSGDVLSYVLVTPPSVGTISNCMGLNSSSSTDRICDYIAPANFQGSTGFTYKLNDGTADSSSSATVTINVTDNTPPALSFSSPAANSTGRTGIDITVACEDGIPLTFSGTGINSSFTTGSNCSGGTFSQTVSFSSGDGVKNITVFQDDGRGNTTTINRDFIRDNVAPSLSSVTIADGATHVGTNFVIVKVESLDNALNGFIRISNSNPITDDCQSEYADNNWQAYSSGIESFSHALTVGDDVKKVCVWAKDFAGNVSSISPSAGTLGVDMDTVIYEVGNAPIVTNFTAVNNVAGPNFGTKEFDLGDQVRIEWTVSDVEELDENPIKLQYTLSSSPSAEWTDIETSFGAIGPGQTNYSYTYTSFNAPTSNFFRIRLVAIDAAGNTSIPAEANILNTGRWSVYLGSVTRGLGGSGRATRLYQNGSYSLIMGATTNPITNDAYLVDSSYGIYRLNSLTGKTEMFIEHGNSNLADGDTLNSSHRIDSTNALLATDSKGRLYVTTLIDSAQREMIIWQIDLQTKLIKKYLGGGSIVDGSATATTVSVQLASYTFDENDTIYFQTHCDQSSDYKKRESAVVFLKASQNSSGEVDSITHIIGDCSRGVTTTGGSDPKLQPFFNGLQTHYTHLTTIAAWDNGNKIYFCVYAKNCFKVINGLLYQSNYKTYGAYYHHANSTLYIASGGLHSVSLNESSDNGDVATEFVNNDGTGNCMEDGLDRMIGCNSTTVAPTLGPGGNIAFLAGAMNNSPGFYSYRYVSSTTDKIYTYAGSKPFYGDGLHKELAVGGMSGIYYKKSTEPNQGSFPEGLYFLDRSAMVLGRVASDDTVNIMFGNQSRAPSPSNGTTLNTSISMGVPYNGGVFFGFGFNDEGLPLFRYSTSLFGKVNSDYTLKTLNDAPSYGHFEESVEGDSASDYSVYVYGTKSNLPIKDSEKIFLLGHYSSTTRTTILSSALRLFDYESDYVTAVMGDIYAPAGQSADDSTGGNLSSKTFASQCRNSCYTQYDEASDRLYFAEENILRYVTEPDNPAASTLGTFFTPLNGSIYNFIFKDDGSQLFYLDSSGNLRCYDISSGKTWCDESKLGPAEGMRKIGIGANQLTWKDSNTLLISTYNGLIYQYKLLP